MSTLIASARIPETGVQRILSTFTKCVAEARPAVLVIHLIRFAAAAAIGVRLTGHLLPGNAAIGAIAWELAIFSVYLFNGVMDVHEDRVNGSRRPIAAGALSRRTGAGYAAGAAALSLASAALEGIAVFCAVTAVLAIGWQYSARPGCLKCRPAGPAAAGAVMGFLAYFAGFTGQAAAAWTHPAPGSIAFAVTMSAWITFVGAPAKDLPDIPGDAAAGRRTLPVLVGERATRRVVAAAALAIAVAFLVAVAYSARLLTGPAATLAAGAIAIMLLSRHPVSTGSRPRRRLLYKVFMLTQYTTNICLLLVAIR